MGQEIACIAHFDGTSGRGKALLETNEITFRGKFRLKVPFSSIKEVKATNGELQVKISDGLLVFELGDKAEKWRDKILNPKSMVEKLGVKPGDHVALHGSFENSFRDDLKKHGARIATKVDSPWHFLSADKREDLTSVKRLAKDLQGAAALWVVYPKGQKSITESDVRGAGLKAGLVDVKVAGFSTTHTALKFVIPRTKR
jgi:hypothetical protein